MSDLTKAIAEALGCRPGGVYDSGIGRQFWCGTHAAWSDDGTCPEVERIAAVLALEVEASTPIDPACIRPGDVVERRQRMTVTELNGLGEGEDLRFWVSRDQGVVWPDIEDGWTWHLVHRPDPDAEAVEALLQAGPAMLAEFDRAKSEGVTKEADEQARDYLAALREQGWDVTRRADDVD